MKISSGALGTCCYENIPLLFNFVLFGANLIKPRLISIYFGNKLVSPAAIPDLSCLIETINELLQF
jgi:hypothetical protein